MIPNILKNILKLSRLNKIIILISIDTILFILSHLISNYLRTNSVIFADINHLSIVFVSFVFILNSFFLFKVYSNFNRYINLEIIKNIFYSCLFYLLLFFIFLLLFNFANYPRSIGIIQPIILFLLISILRLFISRLYSTHLNKQEKINIAIYGAGEAGYKSLNLLLNYNIIYFIDDDKHKQKLRINNIKIINFDEFKSMYNKKNIQTVFVALPSASIIQKKLIIKNLQNLKMTIKVLPSIDQFVSNNISINDFEDININSLLNRKLLKYEDFDNSFFVKKNILITGGGGSIGSEILRQLLYSNTNKLIVLDHNEYNLFKIKEEITDYINSQNLNITITYLLGSICDKSFIEHTFNNHKIDIVFHAAAYKHLNIVEQNIFSSIRNNFNGTYNVAKIANDYKIQRFILISTDKAVKPTNIMGASKRLSEIIIHLISKHSSTIFSIVRFGNVFGSSGSVYPIFKKKIFEKKKINLTSKEVERYFMTINEAVSLVIQSSTYDLQGKTYILNMGKPIKIYDLALSMIKNAKLTIKDKNNLNGDVEINITGLNKGEKLSEELFLGKGIKIKNNENILMDNYELYIEENYNNFFNKLNDILKKNNVKELNKYLNKFVEDYPLN